jgi:uncharacterized OsmC-like protein
MSEQATASKVEEVVLNGVNVSKLVDTIELIKENADIAKFKFRASNKWLIGGHNRSTIKDFYGACQEDTSREKPFVFDNDEPPVLLGENNGANPVEFILHAMAGCITTTFVYYAAVHGVKIDEIESSYEGDLDLRGMLGLPGRTEVGYERIRVKFKVKSDAPREKLEELIDLAQKRSPAANSVMNPVPVSISLETK